MNLRWRDPAAVMHRDFVIFNSNSTITAKFEVKILDNYIKGKMSIYSSKSLKLEVTSGFPIASPITIKYSARGVFYVDG